MLICGAASAKKLKAAGSFKMVIADFSHSYESVVQALLGGNDAAARERLVTVSNWGSPSVFERSNRCVPAAVQVSTFKRDKFVCRYCGRHTVISPLLRLLSIAFGDIFPYQRNWRMDSCHAGYWRDVASCDHLIPIARMGTSDLDNLVTACYMCNSIKQNWLVEELRWHLHPVPTDDGWDGLCGHYPELLRLFESRYPEARIAYFREWRRALQNRS
jgi:hypothetical protein